MKKVVAAFAVFGLFILTLVCMGGITEEALAEQQSRKGNTNWFQGGFANNTDASELQLEPLDPNDAPLSVDDSYTTTENIPLVIPAPGVLVNDIDLDGDLLTTTLTITPVYGDIILDVDGSFVYTPTLNYRGNDRFAYTVSDGMLTDTSNVSITVEPAGMSASPRIGVAPLIVNFTNLSDEYSSVIWDYGDGMSATITATHHSHTYSSSGVYTVTLTVQDVYGSHATVEPAYIAAFTSGSETTYYVDARSGSNATGDGTQTAPWQTITYALNHMYGTPLELRVASGKYDQASGESFPITMKSGISVNGVGYPYTLVTGMRSQPVFLFPGNAIFDSNTVLSGVAIIGGDQGVRVNGISGDGNEPVIRNNLIAGNTHGIYLYTSNGSKAKPLISNNQIINNVQHGLYMYASRDLALTQPTVQGNLISNNSGSGIYLYATGAGVAYGNGDNNPYLLENIIANNGSNGITCHTAYAGGCSPQIQANIIANNTGWGWGRLHDATYLQYVRPTFINNFIFKNGSGGANFLNGGNSYYRDAPAFINNTIAFNGLYGVMDGFPSLVNNIVWGHTSDLNAPVSAVSYSDISQGPYAGQNHNISINPLFVDQSQDDFHIAWDSPLVDLGNSGLSNLPQTDIDGDQRILGIAVEMGADEVLATLALQQIPEDEFAVPGDPLTITMTITNTGTVEQELLATDILPEHVSPSGVITWTLPILFPGENWSEAISMTVDTNYTGLLTNTLILSGDTGIFSSTLVFTSIKPLSGLVVTNSSPTALGNPTRLTASLEEGTIPIYDWDMGDGTIDTGADITHTYTTSGVFTATVTVSNPVSVLTGRTQIIISPAEHRVFLPVISFGSGG